MRVVSLESAGCRVQRLGFAVAFALFATLAHGQSPTYWDARLLLTSTAESTVRLLDKEREVARVQRYQVQRFVDAVDKIGTQFSIRPEVVLVKGDAPNAFATSKDGKPIVGVNVPMLELAGTDPDLAAVVVGHELAHLQLNHMDDARKRTVAIGVLSVIAGAVAGYNVAKRGIDPAPFVDIAILGGALTNRKFDRDQEREADDAGIRAMHRAGYDVSAAPRLWEELQRKGSGSTGWWLSTHPSSDERVETLRKTAVALKPEVPAITTLAIASPAQSSSTATIGPRSVTVADGIDGVGDGSWCVIRDDSKANCAFTSWETCKEVGSNCRPRIALTENGRPQRPDAVRTAPISGRSGNHPWCLAGGEHGLAACSYASWSECNDARPGIDFRCLGRDSELLKSSAPVAVAPDVAVANPGKAVPASGTPPTPAALAVSPLIAAPAAAAIVAPAETESAAARRLRQLQQLRREGLITEEEYSAKRRAILSEL